ncbi:riboflavin biosynthesis protein RibF [Fructilactobacillus sanfranciscensis]|uniref:riboflavin biosynthesis protein RibF n=1 Tax=Fructilactobacillus sanfranciscensis TaxID=1625 RepID=UPI001EF12837|nr:riboflavin biosynthesis protein RibF [Fructilactobacillus sanfranciscensis]MCG7194488.1 riboflavin biosynthesis protein RibF [Fructilactobacillus sanfranciscensis]
MKVINLSYPISKKIEFKRPIVLAMGFFDGVHLGHQKVIKQAQKIAKQKDLPLAVLTYDHHPALVYKKLEGNAARYLSIWERKVDLFAKLGVDIVYRVNYNFAFQAQKPQAFVDNFLMRMNVDTVVAGFDHTYGAKKATMKDLPGYAQGRFNVNTVPADRLDDKKISSTRIRRNLEDGHMLTVNDLLGYSFETTGTVIHGLARGRTLGFPTANLEYSEFQQLPSEGVYIVSMLVNNQWLPAMASIGRNVTFGDHNPVTIEINILGFNQNIYGNEVKVQWLKKMRDEVKYTGKEALIEQLKRDEINTRTYFKNNG